MTAAALDAKHLFALTGRPAEGTIFNDLRHAFRALRGGGRTVALAIALFAVTVGVTTAIYAVVEAVLLRPNVVASRTEP